MQEITLKELERNFDIILKQVEKGKTFKIIDKENNRSAILMPIQEYSAATKPDK